jgi:serine/threonine-protein kinase HipA
VNTALINPADDEELALTLNGKKKKIQKSDFVAAMVTAKIAEKQQQNIFRKMTHAMPEWIRQIDDSFLSDTFKEGYQAILLERMGRLL